LAGEGPVSAPVRRLAGAAAGLLALAGGPARAEPPAPAVAAAVAEASSAFGIPAPWIEAVIAAESGGDPAAVSRAGAMGLMQLMPATWRALRRQLGLGDDPFAVRDNVMAGGAYLSALLARFGAPGFLAAYNAGPARYARVLAGREPLPLETRGYLARLAPALGGGPPRPGAPARDWRRAGLFVEAGLPPRLAGAAGALAGTGGTPGDAP
jgi:soluble lytic murein transglycosylase-like protein